ncbi:MAG: addiction module antitoxin [Geobacter sp.]|jgi:predicted CopG family antitoxin|nr:addiction module antitoxin [Geobacter sp.]
MQKKLTISLNELVYDELCRVVGRGNISKFIEELIKPKLKANDLDAAYSEMAADRVREADALAWANGVVGDSADEKR